MERRHLKISLGLMSAILVSLSPVVSYAVTIGPFTFTPTNTSGTFWAGAGFGSATIDGSPVAIGDVVGAFVSKDSVNDLCIGAYEVSSPGEYGLLVAYGDDTTTPEKDGALDGETVTFKIWDQSNDRIAYATPSGDTTWTNGVSKNVSLSATSGISADDTGTPTDLFAKDQPIYGKATLGLTPNTPFDLYLVVNKDDWTDGDAIPARVPGAATHFTTDANGDMPLTLLYASPTPGSYDILVDVNGNGVYNQQVDYLDDTLQAGAQALAVQLASFSGRSTLEGVELVWETSLEVDNLGWHVYRSENPEGPFERVTNPFINGKGASTRYRFLDEQVEFGHTYYYYLQDIDFQGNAHASDIIRVDVVDGFKDRLKGEPIKPAPLQHTRLLQNYPNPFNPETWIPFELSRDADVMIRIYRADGTLVRTMNLGRRSAGQYLGRGEAVHWDGRDALDQILPSGVYFYTLDLGAETYTRRMLLIK